MDLQPGSRLGRYEIVEPVGEGGMGLVFKARDTRLDRTVAVKVLATEAASDPQSRTRFEREARAISKLNHPHICTLFDVGNVAGTEFLVMEYLEGVTLADRLDRGRLQLGEVLGLAGQILQALDAAHEHGIVHRDLKPANVMLTRAGVKLLDFGLAKLRDPGAEASAFLDKRVDGGRSSAALESSDAPTKEHPVTSEGTILGTFQYMAPEQVEGREADARTDIFAFGALLYEMATGRRAFRATSTAKLIGEILVSEPPPMHDVDATVPPRLEALVRRCLAKEPDDRWQHARDVRWQLEGLLSDTTDGAAGRAHTRTGVHAAWGVATLAGVLVTSVVLWNRDAVPASAAPTVEAAMTLPADTPLNPVNNPALALSPDGSILVFRSGDAGRTRLLMHRLDGSGSVPLTGTENAHTPFFSPDGATLGFLLPPNKVMSVSLAGGAPIEIGVAPSLSYASPGATWGEDGTIVFAAGVDGLMRVDPDAGLPEQLTEPDPQRGEVMHYEPQFLPGGRELLFMVQTNDDRSQAAILSLDTLAWEHVAGLTDVRGPVCYVASGHLVYAEQRGEPPAHLRAVPFDLAARRVSGGARQLGEVYTQPVGPAAIAQFAASATGVLAFVQGERPESALVRVTRDGRVTGLTEGTHTYQYPRVSRDGRRVAVRVDARQGEIHLVETAGGQTRRLASGGNATAPVWNPAGDHVTFASTRADASTGYDMFTVAVEDLAATPTPLLERDHGQFPGAWSARGPVLAYYELGNETARDVWTWSTAEGPAAIVATPANERSPVFSPNGEWLAFISDASGVDEVYIQRYPEGDSHRQVSQGGGTEPVWSPREGELFFRRSHDLLAVTIDDDGLPGPERVVLSGAYDLASPEVGRPNYDVFPDGESFVFVVGAGVSIETVNLRVNWFDELTRRPAGAGR